MSLSLLDVPTVSRRFLGGFTWKEYLLLSWGGLRGAVCLILALLIEQDDHIDKDLSASAALYIASSAFLILFFNGITFEWLYKLLHPYKSNVFRQIYLKKVMRLIDKEYYNEVALLQQHWLFERSWALVYADKLVPRLANLSLDSFGKLHLSCPHATRVLRELDDQELLRVLPKSDATARLVSPSPIVHVCGEPAAGAVEESAARPAETAAGSRAATANRLTLPPRFSRDKPGSTTNNTSPRPLKREPSKTRIETEENAGHSTAAVLQRLRRPPDAGLDLEMNLRILDNEEEEEVGDSLEDIISRQASKTHEEMCQAAQPSVPASNVPQTSSAQPTPPHLQTAQALPTTEALSVPGPTSFSAAVSVDAVPATHSYPELQVLETPKPTAPPRQTVPPEPSAAPPKPPTAESDRGERRDGRALSDASPGPSVGDAQLATAPPIRHGFRSSALTTIREAVAPLHSELVSSSPRDGLGPPRPTPLFKRIPGYKYDSVVRIRSEPFGGALDAAQLEKWDAVLEETQEKPSAKPSRLISRSMSVPHGLDSAMIEAGLATNLPETGVERTHTHTTVPQVLVRDREGEMLIMTTNTMRQQYKRMYEQSFISGTVFVGFMATADVVADFALMDVKRRNKMRAWRDVLGVSTDLDLRLDVREERSLAGLRKSSRRTCLCCGKRREPLDFGALENDITGFEVEWKLTVSRLRGNKSSTLR